MTEAATEAEGLDDGDSEADGDRLALGESEADGLSEAEDEALGDRDAEGEIPLVAIVLATSILLAPATPVVFSIQVSIVSPVVGIVRAELICWFAPVTVELVTSELAVVSLSLAELEALSLSMACL